ncbi:DUF1266 domain-containing protein [Oscillospiraceae bacterium MB08-C2-2]|nr:DUF1266 domain-containing protein [Oscillospiraceae bacterium MB08-C2-2]
MSVKRFFALLLSVVLMLSVAGCAQADPEVDTELQRKLAFGAVLAQRNGMDFTTLGPMNDLDKLRHKEMLVTYWGILDYDTAVSTMERLLYDGMTASTDDFIGSDELMAIFSGRMEVTSEVKQYLAADLADYQKAIDFLEEYGYEREKLGAMTTSIAWDLDRLVTVARWCVGVEYLTKEEAMPYIDEAVSKAVDSYESWEDYFAGVVLGRCLTYDGDVEQNRQVADDLLKNKNSIYKKVDFKLAV